MDGENKGKPYFLMDDLVSPIFGNTHFNNLKTGTPRTTIPFSVRVLRCQGCQGPGLNICVPYLRWNWTLGSPQHPQKLWKDSHLVVSLHCHVDACWGQWSWKLSYSQWCNNPIAAAISIWILLALARRWPICFPSVLSQVTQANRIRDTETPEAA